MNDKSILMFLKKLPTYRQMIRPAWGDRGEVVRCTDWDCEEPDGSLAVSGDITVYLDSRGYYSDQGEAHYDGASPAYCTSCNEEARLRDFTFVAFDFFIYPRNLKDYESFKRFEGGPR